MAFNFCQPFLINRAVSYAEQSKTPQTMNIGYGLIGAYVLVYIGIAVSTGQYQHFTFRFITMMRGGLISMLYNKAADIPLADVDTASSLTLMSADVERIVTGMQTGHEVWANSIEVGLAIYLLKRQLGVACVVPVGVAVGMFCFSVCTITSADFPRSILWRFACRNEYGHGKTSPLARSHRAPHFSHNRNAGIYAWRENDRSDGRTARRLTTTAN